MQDRLFQRRNALIAFFTAVFILTLVTSSVLADPLSIDEDSVDAGNITETSAIITWTTDAPATSIVNYGNTTDLDFTVSDDALVYEHSITITGLGPATRYYFEVQSTDASDNTAIDSNEPEGYAFITDEDVSIGKGLLITVIGMVSVFIVLIIIMYLMMYIQKILGDDKVSLEDEGALDDGLSHGEASVDTAQADLTSNDAESMLMSIGVEVEEDPAKVAAIALALAAYLSKTGKELGKQSIRIGNKSFEVEVSDSSSSPVAVTVNGEKFWASLDGKGLPVGLHRYPMNACRIGDERRGRAWRSAYPPPIGTAWDRRGWSKKS